MMPDSVLLEYDFSVDGNAALITERGFSNAEQHGTWMLGASSELHLPAPRNATRGAKLRLHLSIVPFIFPPALTVQSLSIELDGMVIHQGEHRDPIQLSIDLASSDRPEIRDFLITFRHGRAVSPREVGAAGDDRPLSFLLQRLVLEEIGVEIPDELPAASEQPAPSFDAMPPEVVAGSDGWLFLTGGSNEAVRYFTDPTFFTDEHASRWADLLQERRSRLSLLGARYLHAIAPDKISVYPDRLPFALPNLARSPARLMVETLARRGASDLLIDPLSSFECDPQRDALYMKTDTHWSYHAGRRLLQLVLERIGRSGPAPFPEERARYSNFVGDLGSKLPNATPERHFYVDTAASVDRFFANELATAFEANVRAGLPVVHGGINVAFRNSDPVAAPERVLIFGDSFMDFQQSNATVIFAEHFHEVHFIWSGGIDYGYVERVKPTLVLTEIAERFMRNLPTDDFDVEAVSMQRLKSLSLAK